MHVNFVPSPQGQGSGTGATTSLNIQPTVDTLAAIGSSSQDARKPRPPVSGVLAPGTPIAIISAASAPPQVTVPS